jgi:3-hydroxyisobutyrate dehydrogenase-like beta-hydroxyacid dehydrogenase
VIGCGRMGSAMARRFSDAGYPLVLWNRDRAKADAVAADTGSEVADTPAAAVREVDVVVSSLADDAACLSVYLEPAGVVAGLQPGSVVVETSTVDPETARQIGEAVDATGAGFVDCPVSGSVSTVEAGALTMMAGGDDDLITRVEPVLSTLAKQVIRVGGRGAGAACKLAVNGLVHGLNVALAEALVLAERAGVDREIAYEVFAGGAGGAPFVQYKRDAYQNPDTAPVAFSLDLVRKDLELIIGLGEKVGAPMDQAAATLDIVNQAIEAGLAERDMSAVAIHLRGDDD